MYLNSLTILESQVGYGDLGMHGSLGYEGMMVSVQGQPCPQAFSTHPPARLRFHLGGRFSSFNSLVALNDDVPAGYSHADFAVVADGREVALESYVRAGEPPRALIADISGAEILELVVRSSRWEYSHAVWLDPQVDESPAPLTRLFDCLGRAEMIVPHKSPQAERCIATVVSPGFESLLDDMLGSLYANGGCQDAALVVFILDGNEACERVAAKYRARVIRCESRARINQMSKSALYSVARVIEARHYLCLDADMMALADLRPVFAALDAFPESSILVCREGNSAQCNHLGYALRLIYGGGDQDAQRLEMTPEEEAYSLVVNDGLFAGSRAALLALDGVIRAMPQAAAWIDGHGTVTWRNQFIFNLALARLKCGVELDATYNVQLHVQDVDFYQEGARVRATWHGRQARALHFSGGAKRKYPGWQGKFANAHDPLVGNGDADGYTAFLDALRAWIGLYGLKGLAWTFYGLSNCEGAAVRDPATLPLLAALHYLIRSNGCVRVLETGTARGVSSACLASAVWRRHAGRVVTLDPYLHDGREQLWATLPEAMRCCIEPRGVDSLEGMKVAIEAGERYDAALLDSLHEENHVWAEFQLAAQLVCPGGLILIHDASYANGTVEAALRRVEAAGYNVARLWTAEGGVAEDDRLGLAVIENRRRSYNGFPPDFGADDASIIRAVGPYTMTGAERIQALIQAVRYIVSQNIPGDLVECGVWKGGSVMAMALTLLQLHRQDRTLHLFDTFEGMPPPGKQDIDYLGQPARDVFDQVRCDASQDEVASAVYGAGYDPAKIRFVRGRVEETIPDQAPEKIAILRLDTDWYESTRHELIHLFPRLAPGGVIIIDDYGHWRGSRQATDEYFAENQIRIFLHRIDYTGRLGIKQ